MAIGTDKELLNSLKTRVKPKSNSKGGRPTVNTELVLRLLKSTDADGTPRYNLSQIARMAKCSTKTISRIRESAYASGELTQDMRNETALNTTEADFDEECKRAKGYSFYEWVKQQQKSGQYVFNFTERCWDQLWDRCSLVDVADSNHPLGDQICQKWLEAFSDDKKRIRGRKKQIRYLFRFLGRMDLCIRHLRMTNSRDPRSVRRVPEISMIDFPVKLAECWDYMEEQFPGYGSLTVQLKICSQMRTGDLKAERELWGIRKGTEGKSYLLMSSPDEYRFHLFCKKSEEWDIVWLPRKIRVELWEIYNKVEIGEQLLSKVNLKEYRKQWRHITTKVFGRNLTLHDMRKASITWLYVMGVPLEIATILNVGWKDLSTARDHYLDVRKLLRKSTKEAYQNNIPDWYKEGLGEFTGDETFDWNPEEGISFFKESGHR